MKKCEVTQVEHDDKVSMRALLFYQRGSGRGRESKQNKVYYFF